MVRKIENYRIVYAQKNVVTERCKFYTINVNNQIFYEKEIKKKAGYIYLY